MFRALFLTLIIFFSLLLFPTQTFAVCTYPAEVLDLTNWKVTLPVGSSGSPTEIKQPQLQTFVDTAYFRPNAACDGVVFRGITNGVTTSGSSYPRSELREMTSNGTANASWSPSSGTHTMTIDQAILAVPQGKKHVVAGQIHDANDDVIVIRLEFPKLFVDINGVTGPTLDPNYTLGKRFTVKFVASGGKVDIFYNNGATPAYTLNQNFSGGYFKAGAYTQSNCSTESSAGATCGDSNFGEVVIYALSVDHGTGTGPTSTPDPSLPTQPPAPSPTSTGSTSLGYTPYVSRINLPPVIWFVFLFVTAFYLMS